MSKRKPISQREALRIRRDLKKAQDKLNNFRDWYGTSIHVSSVPTTLIAALDAARALGHIVTIEKHDPNSIRLRAFKL